MVAALTLLALAAQATPRPTLLVMGDSLSAAYGLSEDQGWVAMLGERLAERQPAWEVVNASISGETTSGGASRIAHALRQHRPDLVLIELGANDGLRGLPLELAEANLRSMIEASRKSGARVLLVGMQIPPNYGPQYTRGFIDMYRRLATEQDVSLLPFLLEPISRGLVHFQADRLHPNAEAQPIILDHVWQTLEPLLDADRP
ncbi:arylesterase [Pseudomarimonas salicorniae]|uniref:Arylesterase n=1 Tax=Pseudomarimonas salicorniae TaxID=2933270 RepID=A0ABT0GJP1_9GAMM|nr:arylesterase [Lysobacter sp. CAU 1642]MCK7594769.1 arylesterase [Lysobacter sp. CAU 1642]